MTILQIPSMMHPLLLIAVLLRQVGGAAEPEPFTDDFESNEIGQLPAGWGDLGDIPLPQEAQTVRVITSPAGQPGKVVQITSREGSSQGIYRRVPRQTTYRAQVSVRLDQDMIRGVDNLPINMGFAVFNEGVRPYYWSVSSVLSSGPGNPWWVWTGPDAPVLQDRANGSTPLALRQWYKLSYEFDTVTGRNLISIHNAANGALLAQASFHHETVIGKPYDTFYIAVDHVGAPGGQAILLVDDVVCSDPADDPVPEVQFSMETLGDGTAPAEVVLDAVLATAGEGRSIAEYHWQVLLGRLVVEESAGADLDSLDVGLANAGDYTVTLTITDDVGLCSSLTRELFLRPQCDPATGDWVCEDFQADIPGTFPGTWRDMADVPVDQAGELTQVVETLDAASEPTLALRLVSRPGTTQGIYRRLPPRTRHMIHVDVRIDTDMQRLVDNLPIDVAFAVFNQQVRPFDWHLADVFAGGTDRFVWFPTSITPSRGLQLDIARRDENIQLGTWHRLTFSADTETGQCDTRVVNLVTGRETAYSRFLHQGIRGMQFDTVYLASHQFGGGSGTSATVLADNLMYEDVSGAKFPRARLVADPDRGTAPHTVSFDAGGSLTPGDTQIVSWQWDLGDGTVIENGPSSLLHVYEHPGSYAAAVTITNSAGLDSTAVLRVHALATIDPGIEPWNASDVGAVCFAGGASTLAGIGGLSGMSLRLLAGGEPLVGLRDRLLFVWQEVENTGVSITARIAGVESGTVQSQAGLLIRTSLDEDAACVALVSNFLQIPEERRRLLLRYRASNGVSMRTGPSIGSEVSRDAWLRLEVRRDSAIGSVWSPESETWNEVSRVEMPGVSGHERLLVGLVGCGDEPASLDCDAVYEHLRVDFGDIEIARGLDESVAFRRGACNGDAIVDISDAVCILAWLFSGGAEPRCQAASDINDDGTVDVSDPVSLLGYLFLGKIEPPVPFKECGTDPSEDDLPCEQAEPCS